MSMPLHRLDEYRHKRLEPFAANTIGCLPQQDQRLTHRCVVNPASWARRRSLAWCPLPQQALRVLAVHLCYRNELVEDPALFQTAAPRVSTRYGCHKFVTRCHAHLPHVRLCSLTSKRSKSDEATGLFWAAFRTRQCASERQISDLIHWVTCAPQPTPKVRAKRYVGSLPCPAGCR